MHKQSGAGAGLKGETSKITVSLWLARDPRVDGVRRNAREVA